MKAAFDHITEVYGESVEYFSINHAYEHKKYYVQNLEQLLECQEFLKSQEILGVDVEFTTIQHFENTEEFSAENSEEDIKLLFGMAIASV